MPIDSKITVLNDSLELRNKELEAINTELKRQRSELVTLNDAQDDFITLASHQLRTPATGVKQYIGMLLEGYAGAVTPQQREFLELAADSNERQLTIVNDLLKVARVDSGKMRLHKTSIDLVDMISAVIEEQTLQFLQRQQIVSFRHTSPNMIICLDAEKIRMVIENLIDNASKYTHMGKNITIILSKHKNSFKVAVCDEGVGIAKDQQDKLFQKFSRLDNDLSVLVGGTGLGLYWVKKIVELHGGSINVNSVFGKGSTFSVMIPTECDNKHETA